MESVRVLIRRIEPFDFRVDANLYGRDLGADQSFRKLVNSARRRDDEYPESPYSGVFF